MSEYISPREYRLFSKFDLKSTPISRESIMLSGIRPHEIFQYEHHRNEEKFKTEKRELSENIHSNYSFPTRIKGQEKTQVNTRVSTPAPVVAMTTPAPAPTIQVTQQVQQPIRRVEEKPVFQPKKKKGKSNTGKNIVVTIILLPLFGIIFSVMKGLQTQIINEDTVKKEVPQVQVNTKPVVQPPIPVPPTKKQTQSSEKKVVTEKPKSQPQPKPKVVKPTENQNKKNDASEPQVKQSVSEIKEKVLSLKGL